MPRFSTRRLPIATTNDSRSATRNRTAKTCCWLRPLESLAASRTAQHNLPSSTLGTISSPHSGHRLPWHLALDQPQRQWALRRGALRLGVLANLRSTAHSASAIVDDRLVVVRLPSVAVKGGGVHGHAAVVEMQTNANRDSIQLSITARQTHPV